MSSVPKIVEVPQQLDLSWTQEERGTFRGAAEAWDLWHEWLKTNAPSPEQLYRKLLLDLFFQYRAAHHLGSDFDTNSPAYEEFNRCTGAPVESIDDYVSRIGALLDYLLDHQPNTNAQLARANVAFIVHGDPRLDLVQGNG